MIFIFFCLCVLFLDVRTLEECCYTREPKQQMRSVETSNLVGLHFCLKMCIIIIIIFRSSENLLAKQSNLCNVGDALNDSVHSC